MNRLAAAVASVLVGAFTLAACSSPAPDATAPATTPTAAATAGATGEPGTDTTPAHQSITLAMGTTPNGLTGISPNAANNSISYITQGPGFAFFDPDLNYVRNTDFGTFEEVSTTDNTRTVRYTINDGVTWSDGTPVDAADMILAWASSNNRFVSDGAEWSWASPSFSMGTVSDFPIISDDGRTITFTYNDLRSDWYFQFGSSSQPAHIVARRALGIQDPMEAKQALITAFGGPENYRAQTGTETPHVTTELSTTAGPLTTFVAPNVTEIAQIAEVNNNDWFFTSFPTGNEDLTITMGPYQVVEWVEGEFMRLERNPNFNWYGNVVGRPNVDEITIRFIGDPMAQVQALQNGDVDMIIPQITADTLAAVQNLAGTGVIDYTTPITGTYEHITLAMNNGGVFDPAHWGGNAETARAVRLAFLYTVPREEIVDRLVRPLQSDAVVRDSFTQVPGAPAYAAVTAGNDSAVFNVQDLAQARQLLVDAGLEDQLPLQVRLLFGSNDTRRVDQFELIRAAAPDLFTLVDNGEPAPGWGTTLRSGDGSFDAALFGWGSTSTSPNNAQSNFITGGTNNIGGFHDPEVDRIWDQIITSDSDSEITALTTQMEQRLFQDGFGAVIFQWPGLLAWRANIDNVSAVPFGMQNVWNFWEWQVNH
ncbi:MAG: ABC transporter substrate-binding protein [Cellulomonadaceae bacterium]|nr:ABC transporter substrate-binding protein [Cellulomonadaceae bacterium]